MENKYCMEIKPYPKLDGLMINIPKNIFLDLSEETRFYEFDNNTMNVYKNGKKIESYICPKYVKRCAMSSEIQNIVSNRLISESCVLWYDQHEQLIIDDDYKYVMNIVDSNMTERELKLEQLLLAECKRFAKDQTVEINENVIDGWNIIVERCTRV